MIATTVSAAEGVVLLHGLARSARSMAKMEAALSKAGYIVLNVDYPSRTAPIAVLAEQTISGAVDRFRNCGRIHFVTHSLGGILVRAYLAERALPNLGRVVMLGPPNRGSEVVDQLRGWRLFRVINGPAGQELGTEDGSVTNRLGAVQFELGVIAGDRSINWINSCMIKGKDDGKVSVERTKVDGMKDHLVIHTIHPMMMKNQYVIAATLQFLKAGAFSADAREMRP
jgi:pimeloyl-ACP methyl ester carboxylesterase